MSTGGFRRRGPAAETTQAVEKVQERTVQTTTPKAKSKGGNSNFIKLGAILEKKDGGVYLKFDTNSTAEITVNGKPLKSFQLEDPTAKFDRMVNAGKMTEDEADEAANKIPTYVLYEVTAVVE